MGAAQTILVKLLGQNGVSSVFNAAGNSAKSFMGSLSAVGSAANAMGSKISAATANSNSGLNKLSSNINAITTKMQSASGGFAGGLTGKLGSTKDIQRSLSSAEKSVVSLKARFDSLAKTLNSQQRKKFYLEEDLKRANVKATALINNLKKLKEVDSTGATYGTAKMIEAAEKATESAVFKANRLANKFGDVSSAIKVTSKNMGVVTAMIGKAQVAAGGLRAALAGAKIASSVTSGLKSISNSIKGIPAGINNIAKGFMALNDPIRYVSQATANFGRQLMFIVSMPLIGFLFGGAKAAIGIEQAFVNLNRAANGVPNITQNIDKLKDKLRELAKNTRSSHEDLVGTATAITTAGAETAAGVFNMTMNIEKYAIGTDQSLSQATEQVVKFVNAFGWSLDRNTKEIWQFLNVVNLVGKRTAATAEDVMTAAVDFAPYANMMGFTAAETAAFAAALPSLGLSADEAGTALKNMAMYAIENADKIAAAMGPVNAEYATTADVLAALEDDSGKAAQLFVDIAAAAGDAEVSTSALREVMDIFEMRGGRAIAVMANNTELLAGALDDANKEWVEAASLLMDYDRAMSSTESNIALLKNNLNDAAITLGEAFLPALNEIIQIAVPAIRYLADAFKNLDKKTQLLVVGAALAAVVLGPALMVVGQLVHYVSMLFMGLGLVVKAIAWVASGLISLGPVISGVASFFLSWPGLVLIAVAGILKVLDSLGVDIAGVFRSIGNAAKTWGENLAANLSNGLMAGAARYVTRAINWVSQLIASFFESHSPPEAGPLSTIDKWGIALMETFMSGFRKADFSLLSEIGGIIERELTRGVDDEGMPGALGMVKNAREAIAKMMTKYNDTGVLDAGLMDSATQGLGALKDNVQDLIKQWITYRDLQQQIEDLEKKRLGILDNYNASIEDIGASDMTAEEKVAAIRDSMRARDKSLRGISAESKALEEQSGIVQEQYEYQQAMIGALQDQGDLFARIADALDRLSKAGGGGGGGIETPEIPAFAGGGGGGDPEGDPLGEEWQDIVDRFSEGKKKLDGFLAGWNGIEPLTREDFGTDEAYDAYMAFYNLGVEADKVRDKIVGFGGTLKQLWADFTGLFSGEGGGGGGALTGITESVTSFFTGLWESILKIPQVGGVIEWAKSLGEGLADSSGAWSVAGDQITELWNNIKALWEDLKAAFENPVVQGALAGIAAAIATVWGVISGLLAGIVSGIITGASYLLSGIVTVITGAINLIVSVIRIIINYVMMVINFISGNSEAAKENFLNIWDALRSGLESILRAIFGVFVGIFGGIKGVITGFITGASAYIRAFIDRVIGFFKWLYDVLIGHSIIPDLVNGIISFFTEGFASLISLIGEKLNAIKEFFATAFEELRRDAKNKFQEIKDAILTTIEDAKLSIKEKWANIKYDAETLWEEIKTSVSNKVQEIYDAIRDKVEEIRSAVESKWNEIVSNATGPWGTLLTDITGKAQEIYDSVTGKFGEILTELTAAWTDFNNAGKDLIQGFIDGITSKATELTGAVKTFIQTAIAEAMALLKEKSPSRVFMEIGANAGLGFISGIEDISSETRGAMQVMLQAPTLGMAQTSGLALSSQSAFGGYSQQPQIVMNFGKDSVRSDDDIEKVAQAVERVLNRRAQSQRSYGIG